MIEASEKTVKKWTLHEAFVQAKLFNGFRYLDLSGVVLNRIGKFYEEKNIDPAGCLLRRRTDVRD